MSIAHRMRSDVPALLLAALAATAAFGQTPERPETNVQESVGVSLVEVPVSVVDASGRSVAGLTREDFEVLDDGKPVAIESLDESLFPAAGETPSPDPKTRPRAPRTLLFVYDLAGVTNAELDRANAAGRRFVNTQMGPADVAGVATIGPSGDVKLVQNLARDREKLAAAFDSVKPVLDRGRNVAGVSPSAEGGGKDRFSAEELEQLARPGRAQQAAWVERLLDALKTVAQALQPVPGRKQLILFSHGFNMMLDDTRLANDVRKIVDELRMQDCVVNIVNVAGLSASAADSQALFVLANDTGGHLMENSNDLSGQLGRVLEANRVVYELTFRTTLTGHPGRFHPIEVRTRAKGTKVFAREGYVEPKPS